ncbi:unnamed protein product, partial [Rotaria sp. Silwood2]
GYCLRSLNVTNVPLQLIALKKPHWNQVNYPTIQREFPFTSIQWQKLIGLLDAEKFQMLDDRIGCPDCADGGAEWIQVNWSKKSKRVIFEYGALVNSIEEFSKNLRVLREQYLKNL